MRIRLLGLTVVLHYSLLIGFCVITWALSTSYFVEALSALPTSLHWAAAIIATSFIFLSLLLHELAHALVARHYGYPTTRIILHLLGGWTILEREPETPRRECLVALAGPLASLMIAALAWPLSHNPIAYQVYKINLILGAYNLLLPCFPMDGGRLLRAFLWNRYDSFSAATEQAAALSMQLSIGLMILSVLGRFVEAPTFWLILVGAMLRIIADGTYQTVSHSRHLSGLVREAMIPAEHVLTLHEAMSLQDFQQMFLRYGFRGYPVLSRSTVTDLVVYDRVKDHPRWLDPDNTSVRDIMIPLSPDMTIAGTSSVQQALDCMLVRGRAQLLVFDGSAFAGLLTRSAITRMRAAVTEPDRPWWRLGKPPGTRPT